MGDPVRRFVIEHYVNISMFKQRVSGKLKEELYRFFEKNFESELGQLLEALAQQSPSTPFLRNKLQHISRTGFEKELNAIRTKAFKLEEARRNPVRETPALSVSGTPTGHPPQSHSTPHQPQPSHQPHQPQPQPQTVATVPATPAQPDPQRAQQEDGFCNAALSGDLTTVQTLLTQGVNVNCSQQGGWTALMNATLQGHATVVDALIRAGADLNLKDNGGFTALMYAASYRRYNIAESLVKAGANLDIADNAGRNILQYAQSDPQVKDAIQKGQAGREQQLAQQRVQTSTQSTQSTPSTAQAQPALGYGYPTQQFTQGYPTTPTPTTPTSAYGTPVSTPSYLPQTSYGVTPVTTPTTPGTPSVPQTLGYGQPYQGYPAGYR